MDEGLVHFIERTDCLANPAVGGVLKHLTETQATLNIVPFDAFVMPGVISSPERLILMGNGTRGTGPRALFAGFAKP